MKKVISRTRSVGAKLTDEQYVLVQQRAAEMGISPGEFLRAATLEKLHAPREMRVLIAEMARLENVVLGIMAKIATGEEVKRAQVERLVAEADRTKFSEADDRIQEGLNAPSAATVLASLGAPRG